jgi:hypothetical protein
MKLSECKKIIRYMYSLDFIKVKSKIYRNQCGSELHLYTVLHSEDPRTIILDAYMNYKEFYYQNT